MDNITASAHCLIAVSGSFKPLPVTVHTITEPSAILPIILMYANARTKQGGILGKIYPTDLQKDLEQIKALYAEYDIDVKIN